MITIKQLDVKKYFPFFFILLLMVGSRVTQAQQKEMGNWLMYFGTNRLNEDFSIHSEVQYRNHTFSVTDVEQLLLRTGLNYHFHKSAMVTVGYAHIGNYEFESEQTNPEVEEHRIWQQLIFVNQLGRVKLEHRYRLEQRWIEGESKGRYRYRLMFFLPINKQTLEEGAIFLGMYDEIFLNSSGDYFDRNRLYGAVGYQISKSTGLQVGMLRQQVSDYGKWHFQLAVLSNIDLFN